MWKSNDNHWQLKQSICFMKVLSSSSRSVDKCTFSMFCCVVRDFNGPNCLIRYAINILQHVWENYEKVNVCVLFFYSANFILWESFVHLIFLLTLAAAINQQCSWLSHEFNSQKMWKHYPIKKLDTKPWKYFQR